jgi:hypothetical protein
MSTYTSLLWWPAVWVRFITDLAWNLAERSKAWVFGHSLAEIVGSNPTGGMDVCCECCVLWGRGLCDELITHPEESYRLWCVVVCDLETSRMRRPWPTGGAVAPKTNNLETRLTETMEEVEWLLRTSLFWVVTQRVVVICYRLFGTAYRFRLQGWTDRLSRNVGNKLTITRCLTTQKSEVLIYFTAETWSHTCGCWYWNHTS